MFIATLFTIVRTWKEKAMATHSSTLAWKISWTKEPGRLQSMGSRRVGHDWCDLAAAAEHESNLDVHQQINHCLFNEDCFPGIRRTISEGVPVCMLSLSHGRLCDPIDCIPPGSSVRGILQARILEWIAISCSKGSSSPRDQTHVFCIGRWILYPLSHLWSLSKGKTLQVDYGLWLAGSSCLRRGNHSHSRGAWTP